MQQVVELGIETKHAVVIDPMVWPDYLAVEVDLVDHLGSILFVRYISWRDGWFVMYKSLAVKENKHFVDVADWYLNTL